MNRKSSRSRLLRNAFSGARDRGRVWLAAVRAGEPCGGAKDRRTLVLFLFALLLFSVAAVRAFSLLPAGSPSAPGKVVWLEGDLADGLYLLPSGTTPAQLHYWSGLEPPSAGAPAGESIPPHATVRLLSGQKPHLASAMPPSQALLFFLPMDLNRADQESLVTIPGIGPRLAERIIALREQRGSFRSTDDLLAVKGIGPAKIKKIRDFVAVEDEL